MDDVYRARRRKQGSTGQGQDIKELLRKVGLVKEYEAENRPESFEAHERCVRVVAVGRNHLEEIRGRPASCGTATTRS